ncbi:stalk domain-containing protein [Paenibacillus pasadenensis]|uniref:stalk domain-containing protein n=1 Tax=Paenibacillus pasadenensis TaxID=217090 RepID=UPI00203ED0C0|nr:stalk domain-containing protein [Paenibacillus pasadenensis]MCM3750309.1 stalk domain-containing protein [Paenibacillus pasadenensis]
MRSKRWPALNLLALAALLFLLPGGASANEASRVADFDGFNYLLEDGTVWVEGPKGYSPADIKLTSIENGYGLTASGELVLLDNGKAQRVKGATGIKALSGTCLLKQDGTVWNLEGGNVKGTAANASMVYCDDLMSASINPAGELFATGNFGNLGKLVDRIDAESVSTIRASGYYSSQVAVLYKSGKLTIYDYIYFDHKNLEAYVPQVMAEDAVSVAFGEDDTIVVVRKDGTVWHNSYSSRFKMAEAYPGISGAAEILSITYNSALLRMQNGDLEIYGLESGKREKVELPVVANLKLTLETSQLTVGEKVPVTIEEQWSGSSYRKVPLAEANLVIEKPSLLQKLPDGTLKALAVGETDVTVTSGGQSKTVRVSISSAQAFAGGVYTDGVMYLPLQRTFKELGMTVSADAAAKTFTVKQGKLSISLKLGSASAVINGQTVTLPGKVHKAEGSTVFPAALLKTAIGAQLNWNSSYQYMTVGLGKAKLQVQTERTAQILKKELLGSLTKLIGKSYWVNHFDSNYRFQKVTITDIVPDGSGSFTIYFKLPSGSIVDYTTYGAEQVRTTLGNSENFLTADPYKTYKWSQSSWALIKQGKITTGMNKDQVLLSWGRPNERSTLTASGITAETWRYGVSNYVTFTNGKVSFIYTG